MDIFRALILSFYTESSNTDYSHLSSKDSNHLWEFYSSNNFSIYFLYECVYINSKHSLVITRSLDVLVESLLLKIVRGSNSNCNRDISFNLVKCGRWLTKKFYN